ncbi:unnamed protein product, partial [Ectocarpus fasciculatus]
ELQRNLISISKLDDDGCEINIKNGVMQVHKQDKLIIHAEKDHGLYQFDMEGTETALLADVQTRNKTDTLRRVHHRLGHRNLLRIRKAVNNKLMVISQWPANVSEQEIKSLPLCDPCMRSKFNKRRLRRRENIPTAPGESVSTDFKGPMRIKGINGERYYQGFIDRNTKYLLCTFSEFKSDAPKNLRGVLAHPMYSGKLLHYHADGAPELISQAIVSVLDNIGGVRITFSPPYTSVDNALIERSHKTVFEAAHSMLLHASLSTTFWCYAVAHAVYLFNRIPTSTEKGYMAPIQAAFAIVPDMSHEPTFGCSCYTIAPAETRARGFTEKACKGHYLGHRADNAPGYYVFNLELNKVVESSHVTFDENYFSDNPPLVQKTNGHLHAICNPNEADKGEVKQDSAAGRPLAERHGSGDGPKGGEDLTPKAPSAREPAASGRVTRSVEHSEAGEPASRGEPLVPPHPKRERKQRVQLNVGALGDIEKTFLVSENDTDYEINLSDIHAPDVLLYSHIFNVAEEPQWCAAAQDELASILENGTWQPATLPPGFTPLTCKWIFKKKKHPARYKARLCVRGFRQRAGVDYAETYAPTAKWTTLRLFLSIVACKKMVTRQLDVKTAFLYANLEEEVYIRVPDGVNAPGNPLRLPRWILNQCRGEVLRLLKSLYGLKQAPRNWFLTLRNFLRQEGFRNLLTESCIFVKYVGATMIIILVFVDDILVGTETTHLANEIVQKFEKRFKISDGGEVSIYLSIHIERLLNSASMGLDQKEYIMQLWKAFRGKENRYATTPLQENFKLVIDEELAAQSDEDRAFVDSFPYRELIGSMLFIMICTRPDIAFAIHYLARFNSKPCKMACLAARRVLQYLYNTRDKKLYLGGTANPLLSLFCDTDYASCPDTRKSVECFLLFFGNGCISWQVKQQPRVAQSTGEAEYCAVTPGVNEIVWIRALLSELGCGYRRAAAAYTDNNVALVMLQNPVHHSRMKQISVKYHMLRALLENNVICGGRIATDVNPADVGTKPL